MINSRARQNNEKICLRECYGVGRRYKDRVSNRIVVAIVVNKCK